MTTECDLPHHNHDKPPIVIDTRKRWRCDSCKRWFGSNSLAHYCPGPNHATPNPYYKKSAS